MPLLQMGVGPLNLPPNFNPQLDSIAAIMYNLFKQENILSQPVCYLRTGFYGLLLEVVQVC